MIYWGVGFSGSNLLLAAFDPVTNFTTQDIYSLPVVRNLAGTIVGFGSPSSITVNLNNGDFGNTVTGGLGFLPNGTMFYTTATENFIGQYASGVSSLTAMNDPYAPDAFLGGLAYLPAGNGAQMVATFSNGDWFAMNVSSKANQQGFYQLTLGARIASGIEADSLAYAAPGFLGAGAVVGDINDQVLALYGLDANGLPTRTRIPIVNGNGTGIGYGVTVDPRTGDVLFTTSNDQIWLVDMPTPEPGTAAGLAAAAAALWWLRRRRLSGRKS
jgi:hypothetical protein